MAFDVNSYRAFLAEESGNYDPVFWSGSVDNKDESQRTGEENSKRICEEYNNAYADEIENGEEKPWKTNEMLLEEWGSDKPEIQTETDDVMTEWKSSSEAFAEGSSGEAKLIVGDNTSYDGVLNNTEKQAIRENDAIETDIELIDENTGEMKDTIDKNELSGVETHGSGYEFGGQGVEYNPDGSMDAKVNPDGTTNAQRMDEIVRGESDLQLEDLSKDGANEPSDELRKAVDENYAEGEKALSDSWAENWG